MPLKQGTKLGPYEVVSAIGAGGMGDVYRARDTRLGRDVALKVLSESFTRDPERLRRFEQEARAVAALNHPNILALFARSASGRCLAAAASNRAGAPMAPRSSTSRLRAS